MDTQIYYAISGLLQHGIQIQNNLQSELQSANSPLASATRRIIAEGGGSIAAGLLGTRKARAYGKQITAGLLRDQKAKTQQEIVGRYYGHYQSWLGNVVSLLSRVSVDRPNIKAPGNSQSLVKKVNRAESFKRLETRIRHVLTQLEELRIQDTVWNASLTNPVPKAKAVIQPDPGESLRNLENLVRRCIERELSRLTSNWWTKRIPADVRKRAESRKQRSETVWPWHPPASTNLVDFLDFSDYRKIILDPSNWTDSFAGLFASQTFIESRLGELEPIRNDFAHSRQIGKTARAKLQIYVDELRNCIGDSIS